MWQRQRHLYGEKKHLWKIENILFPSLLLLASSSSTVSWMCGFASRSVSFSTGRSFLEMTDLSQHLFYRNIVSMWHVVNNLIPVNIYWTIPPLDNQDISIIPFIPSNFYQTIVWKHVFVWMENIKSERKGKATKLNLKPFSVNCLI